MRNLLLIAFAIISISVACTKISTTEIGNGLIPPVDNVNTFDTTLEVFTNTFENQVLPPVYKTDDHVIGVLNDPIFGKTVASAFFEFKPTIYPYAFPINPIYRVADSAVLVLNFRGSYGDTSVGAPNQEWEVRELAELGKGDSVYKTNANPAVGALLNSGNTTINVRKFRDSVINKFESTVNQVRIKLSHDVALRFIKNYDSTNAYRSDSAFREAFKGFAIVPRANSGGNTLARVNLMDMDSKLALYFHKDSANVKSDTSVNFFRINPYLDQSSFTANRIARDFSGSEIAGALNTTTNEAKVYALTAPGTYINVTIPGLRTLSNRIIHRAELLAYQEDADNDPLAEILTPPRYLLLARYDNDFKGMASVPNDYEITSTGPNIENFGGFQFYQNIPGFNKKSAVYTFNLSRYVQGIVSRKDSSYALRIYAPSNDSIKFNLPYPNQGVFATYQIAPSNSNRMAEGRVRLAGGAHPNERVRMRVRIIYSRL
ncbi:DUF4270 family protein [Aridibaculum aurantiacum]|uniref:DUF4270 family protein n=1 Tax=Aridibaculum aurantiacum TaxID=2810307 RepID=UPI001A969D93|nr:DUF4270 family protein [Aridibaculum aurantiacum]